MRMWDVRALALCLGLGQGCGDDGASGSSPVGTTGATGATGATSDQADGASTGTAAPGFPEAFEAQGFTVQRGRASSFLLEDCAQLTQCFGNNASTPYLLFSVPPFPGRPETAPPSSVGDIPKVPEGMTPAYRLEAHEAVVIVGQTPPPARYFGFTPYLFERTAPDGTRVSVFASLGDSINQVNAQTAGGPFDAPIAVVASADAQTTAEAEVALLAAGVPTEAIQTLVLPAERLRLGLGPDDDTTLLLGRIALFDDPAAEQAYLSEVPLEVYRLTPESGGEPLPTPPRTPRGDGTTEDALAPALDALQQAVEAQLGEATYEVVPIASAALVAAVIDPERCLDEVTECLGDNSDTTYAAGPIEVPTGDGVLTLGPDDYFVAFGVNHEAAGKATYSNMAVYSKEGRVGVAAVDSRDFPGSAAAYLPDHPDADLLWAWEVRRECAGRSHCLPLPTTFPGVPLDESMFFIFRAYLQPGLSVSAAPGELLPERVFVVRG